MCFVCNMANVFGFLWIIIRILYGSVYKFYVNLYVYIMCAVYMLTCLGLIENVKLYLKYVCFEKITEEYQQLRRIVEKMKKS